MKKFIKEKSFNEKERVRKFLPKNSLIKVICNSDAKIAKVIGYNRKDFKNSVIVSLKKVLPNGKRKTGEIYQAIVTTLKKPFLVPGVGVFRFPNNTCVLVQKIGKDWKLVGNSINNCVSSLVFVDNNIGNIISNAAQGGVF